MSFAYAVCTSDRGTCYAGSVDVTIEPATLVVVADPAVTVTTGESTLIPASMFLSNAAGADWTTLTATSTTGSASAVQSSISYTAPSTPGTGSIRFSVCPLGDPSTCVTGTIGLTVLAPTLTAVVPATTIPVSTGDTVTDQRSATSTAAGSSNTSASTQPTSAVQTSSDVTWYVIGGALLFMFGSGATVLSLKKH